ncbi:MAG: KpsF/GutQ family sugar-phosphate isomerase [Calditrichota bacterium]
MDRVLNPPDLLEVSRQIFFYESEALQIVARRLDESFLRALELLERCSGKIIATGLGKSGIAARKIAATLASTGAPALFMHASEAGHGDLGVVTAGDVVLALSYSGETRELVELVPRLKLLGVPVIAITGGLQSTLAELADVTIDINLPEREWPFGLIPTASNVVTVAVGDALAVALVIKRGIKEQDFARFHPGGLLGRRLLVRVEELMHTGEALPVVHPEAGFREVLMEMTAKRLGVACVVDDDSKLKGIFTDGDLRRLLERTPNPLELSAREIMIPQPKSTNRDQLCAGALHTMETHNITSLPVLDEAGTLVGLVHIHDILKLETTR